MDATIIAGIFAGIAVLIAAVGKVAHSVFTSWLDSRAKELHDGSLVHVMSPDQVNAAITETVRRVIREEIERERELLDAKITRARIVPLENRVTALEVKVWA